MTNMLRQLEDHAVRGLPGGAEYLLQWLDALVAKLQELKRSRFGTEVPEGERQTAARKWVADQIKVDPRAMDDFDIAVKTYKFQEGEEDSILEILRKFIEYGGE